MLFFFCFSKHAICHFFLKIEHHLKKYMFEMTYSLFLSKNYDIYEALNIHLLYTPHLKWDHLTLNPVTHHLSTGFAVFSHFVPHMVGDSIPVGPSWVPSQETAKMSQVFPSQGL